MVIHEQIEILQAYERGEGIEFRKLTCDNWNTLVDSDHQFNFYMFEYRIKPKKWRAEKMQTYYYVDSFLNVTCSTETDNMIDYERFKVGNYFKEESDAKALKDRMRSLVDQFHNNKD